MKFKKTTLSNGVRVITVPMAGNPTVTVMVSVATGSFYENAKQSGISHFLEHMCFKGTTKRPSPRIISTELDSIGAAYNAFTSYEVTGYWAKADTRHFDTIADIVADIFSNSILPKDEIEREKGVVKGEIDMYADDPQEKIAEALTKHMYKGETAERHILGSKETVDAITHDALVAYRKSQYTAPNTIVTVAGGISEEKMIAWAEKSFVGMEKATSKPEIPTKSRAQSALETVFIDKDTDQAHLIMAWRAFDKSHPDRYVARLTKNILRGGMSSRLFIKLREEMGSGYYIGAGISLYKSFGNFSISTGTTPARVPEIITAIIGETERLKTEKVGDAELNKIKELMRAHLVMSLETSDGLAEFTSEQETLENKIRTPKEFDAIFSKVTADDVLRVANTIFDNNKLTIAVIGQGIDKDKVRGIMNA